MSEQQITVNAEKIMQEIRAEIKEKGLDKEILSFEQIDCPTNIAVTEAFDQNVLDCNISGMNQTCSIQADHPIYGNVLVCVLKKIIRKLMRFYVLPIVEDQTKYNAFTVRSLNCLRAYVLIQQKKDEQIEDLNKRIISLEKLLREKE